MNSEQWNIVFLSIVHCYLFIVHYLLPPLFSFLIPHF
jgi:hypothetical protein